LRQYVDRTFRQRKKRFINEIIAHVKTDTVSERIMQVLGRGTAPILSDVQLANEPDMEIGYISETYLPRLLQGK
jgi:hypothetical protein